MADTGIFATTAEVQYMAGANCSATANTETYINAYMTMAESEINAITNYNWSDAYSGLNVDKKGILKAAAASRAASRVISFDMSGMGITEGQTRLDLLKDIFDNCVSYLKLLQVQTFVKAA